MTTQRRQLLGLMAGLPLFGGAALAQTPEAPAPVVKPLPRVKLTTAKGVILIEVRTDVAPVTGANFLRYIDEKRYAPAEFYRVMTYQGAPSEGILQGGLAHADNARRLPGIKHEPTTQTGLTHKEGAVSIARFAPGTATSEFFICSGDSSNLDANPKLPGDNLGFAAFAQVIEGMDVVRLLMASPVSPTKGADAGMKGQILEPFIPIRFARAT